MAGDSRTRQLRVSRSAFWRVVLGDGVKAVGMILLALIVTYACVAATLLRVVPGLETGLVPVKNVTFPGGQAPAGAVLLVDTAEPQESSILGRLKQAFVPSDSTAVVKVLAGPYGSVAWAEPGVLAVDGKVLPVDAGRDADGRHVLSDRGNGFLRDEYVLQCVKGGCQDGQVMVLPASHVVGAVVGEVS